MPAYGGTVNTTYRPAHDAAQLPTDLDSILATKLRADDAAFRATFRTTNWIAFSPTHWTTHAAANSCPFCATNRATNHASNWPTIAATYLPAKRPALEPAIGDSINAAVIATYVTAFCAALEATNVAAF
jgi:hypothetical protein